MRSWTRLEQRRYRDERKEQSASVAARLLGKKKYPFAVREPLQHLVDLNFENRNPRSNIYIQGITT